MGFIELRGVNFQRAIETGEVRRCLSVICCVLRSGFRHQYLFFHQEQETHNSQTGDDPPHLPVLAHMAFGPICSTG
jgi:hypothetical protein